jgi:hypothetical protein
LGEDVGIGANGRYHLSTNGYCLGYRQRLIHRQDRAIVEDNVLVWADGGDRSGGPRGTSHKKTTDHQPQIKKKLCHFYASNQLSMNKIYLVYSPAVMGVGSYLDREKLTELRQQRRFGKGVIGACDNGE